MHSIVKSAFPLLLAGLATGLPAAARTVPTNRLGNTPGLLAYGAGQSYLVQTATSLAVAI